MRNEKAVSQMLGVEEIKKIDVVSKKGFDIQVVLICDNNICVDRFLVRK